MHPIRHIGNVPFGERGKQTYIKNVLHVPTITKNLVSVGQIVEQGMQVRFNNNGCFIEKHGRVIAKGRRDGLLFILNSTYPTKGTHKLGKKTEAIEEPSQEGGASTPSKVGKQRHLRAITAAKSAITKRNAEIEEANRPQQVDNSQITPRTRNT